MPGCANAATNESKDLLSVVGCIDEFCDGDCAENIMLARDTQCVQSLCTGRYDALYVQRYRQTTGKCDAKNFDSLYPLK